MKYEKLLQLARAMPDAERDATLRQLANDPRLAAVVKLLLDQQDATADEASEPRVAGLHGSLAHAAGGRYAMRVIESQIRAACAPKRARADGPPAAPEED